MEDYKITKLIYLLNPPWLVRCMCPIVIWHKKCFYTNTMNFTNRKCETYICPDN